ncbi:hypothetical protein [Marinifilum fragile]|uniref:hypothetical protein n=1 Tax=Marinifilum fragile TaxID=570161 RepID=UPI002AABF204|nr:hypothetical protein [Marinifilum fragile]
MKDLDVLKEKRIEAGLYRGFCSNLPDENIETGFKGISWVSPNSEQPDFHIPSSFGALCLE